MHALDRPVLLTAKPQRWKPEEFLRPLVAAEIAARDASNVRIRMRQAGSPVAKRLEEFDVAASSIPRVTFGYLPSLEWIRAAELVCMIGPAGTGKSHTLIGLGIAAVEAEHRSAPTPPPSWSGPALGDWPTTQSVTPSTPCFATTLLVDELGSAPRWTTPEPRLLFRFVAAAYERRSLGIASHWPFESWGRFLPEHTTAVSMLDRLQHPCHTVVTDRDSYRMRQVTAKGGTRVKTS